MAVCYPQDTFSSGARFNLRGRSGSRRCVVTSGSAATAHIKSLCSSRWGEGWQGGREHRSERPRMVASEERSSQHRQRRPAAIAGDGARSTPNARWRCTDASDFGGPRSAMARKRRNGPLATLARRRNNAMANTAQRLPRGSMHGPGAAASTEPSVVQPRQPEMAPRDCVRRGWARLARRRGGPQRAGSDARERGPQAATPPASFSRDSPFSRGRACRRRPSPASADSAGGRRWPRRAGRRVRRAVRPSRAPGRSRTRARSR